MSKHPSRAFGLVGPGRAGTALALALQARGWRAAAVSGRPGSDSLRRAVALLGAPVVETAQVGEGAELVLVATPDAAIASAALEAAPGLQAGALVLHLSGACTLGELDKLAQARPDVARGSLHPLQSLPTPEIGVERLRGSWCAVDGPPEVERLAVSLGMRPFRVDEQRRAEYHAAGTIASNHLVALLAQAARVAESAGVPAAALLPLVRSTVDNWEQLGAAALTGPVARGDVDTVRTHLASIAPEERDAYRALAEQARRLAGRDDDALRVLLEEPS